MAAVVRFERLAQSRFILSLIPQISVDINAPKYFTFHTAITQSQQNKTNPPKLKPFSPGEGPKFSPVSKTAKQDES